MELEDLTPDIAVRGLIPEATAHVIAVEWHSSDTSDLVSHRRDGQISSELLIREDYARLEIVAEGPPHELRHLRQPRQPTRVARRIANAHTYLSLQASAMLSPCRVKDTCSRLIFGLILTVVVLTSSALAQTRQEIAQTAFASTVTILVSDHTGQPLGLGSGFSLGGGWIVTNTHVVAGATSALANHESTTQPFEVTEVLHFNPAVDLAILNVPGIELPPLPLAHSSDLVIGDTVYAVGSPQGLEATFSMGIVSGFRSLDGRQLIQMTAPISPGSSGGPVLNGSGEVIGIAVAAFSEGQNLNFAVPVDLLIDMLQATPEPTPVQSLAAQIALPGGNAGVGEVLEHAVECTALLFEFNGRYTFSVRNRLDRPISGLRLLVVFYDESGFPLEADSIRVSRTIMPGLGVRVTGQVDSSIQLLTTGSRIGIVPETPIALRVLGFVFATVDQQGSLVVRVQPGDSLWSIARAHGTTVADLMAANGLADDERLTVGQELRIP